ncbi:hypothetical protein ABVT39_023605 [Epinephelus coioides]
MDFLKSLTGDTDIAKAAGEFVESEVKSFLGSGDEKAEGAPSAEGDAPVTDGEKTDDVAEDSGENKADDPKEPAENAEQ